MKYKISYTNRFKKALRQCQKRGYDMELFRQVSSNSDNLANIHLQLGKNISLIGDIFLPN